MADGTPPMRRRNPRGGIDIFSLGLGVAVGYWLMPALGLGLLGASAQQQALNLDHWLVGSGVWGQNAQANYLASLPQ